MNASARTNLNDEVNFELCSFKVMKKVNLNNFKHFIYNFSFSIILDLNEVEIARNCN